jgi:hypothetical protein
MVGDTTVKFRAVIAAVALLLAPLPVAAQAVDVPYVPTPTQVVDAMLKLAHVGPNDYVIDLGSGDGRIVIAAAKQFGARGMGVDLDAALVSEARRQAARAGVSDKVRFEARNLFITDISKASVLTMYLFPSVHMQLRPRIFSDMKPGTRIVSHEFDFGTWKPDAKQTIGVPDKRYGPPSSNVFLWIVPANAAGTWRSELDSGGNFLECELTLEQKFQALTASARLAGEVARVEKATLHGDRLSVILNGSAGGRNLRVELDGRVSAEIAQGTARIAGAASETQWHAIRTTRGKIDIE